MVSKSTMEQNLEVLQKPLRKIYGDDFVIKPEGVIDNIAVAVSGIKMDFEDQLLALKKNLNPYTARGQAQDSLYALRNLARKQSTYTVVQRTIEGTPNSIVVAGSLLFENSITKDQFLLDADVTIGEGGKVVGSFKSLLIGAVDLPNDANLNILTPLENVSAVYYSTGNDINIGVEYQSNEDFCKEFLKIQNVRDSLELSLLKLVDNPGDLKIIQNRGRQVYDEIPLRSKKITIYSAESDKKIAQTIFENMEDSGFDLVGDIKVSIEDIEGQPVDIYFNRASGINVYVKTWIVKNSKYTDAEAKSDAKLAIMDYYGSNSFVMGEKVVGNRFNASIDAKSSVQYPVKTQVSSDGSVWVDVLDIGALQVPVFAAERVEVEIEEN